MSGTTVKTAPAETSTGKTKKPATSKKVAKTTARKTRSSTASAKKKSATKKAVAKKSAVKKPPARKVSKKATGRRGVTIAQRQETPASIQTTPDSANSAPEDNKSLSWMSAQAASALKAVKASQAEKGQAVLARTRKQATETHLDDDSLIRIAAEMPVDNDALVEFSTEQPLVEDHPQEPEATSPAGAAAMGVTSPPGNSHVTSEPAMAAVEIADTTPPAEQQTQTETPAPPQQRAKHSAALQLTLAAGLLFAALLLGYYIWPVSDDSSAVEATRASDTLEAPVAASDPVDTRDTTTNVATVPAAEPGQETAEINNSWTPSDPPNSWEPTVESQTATVPPATEPEPELKSEPAPSSVESVPVVATQVPQPADTAQPVQPEPAVPAQPARRAPAQGYYSPQHQPTYPPYYYR